jgi:hypothetical protein
MRKGAVSTVTRAFVALHPAWLPGIHKAESAPIVFHMLTQK